MRWKIAAVLVVLALPALSAMPGYATARTFTKPEKIGTGGFPSAVSDGKHIYLSGEQPYDGIYYTTNDGGAWKSKQVVKPKQNTNDFRSSIARDAKGNIYIAYSHAAPIVGPPVGVFYVTNKTGHWVKHRVSSGDDFWPSIGVAKGKVYVAFRRGNPEMNAASVHLATISKAGKHLTTLTDVKGTYGTARLVMQGGKPTVVYSLQYARTHAACGIYVYRAGATVNLTTGPDFTPCRDDMGNNNGWSFGSYVLPIVASDGLHVFTAKERDPNVFDDPGGALHLYVGSGGVVDQAVDSGMGFLTGAAADGDDIYVVGDVEVTKENSTHYVHLHRNGSTWNAGSLVTVTTQPDKCYAKGGCDENPTVAVAHGKPQMFIPRRLPSSSPRADEEDLYLTHP